MKKILFTITLLACSISVLCQCPSLFTVSGGGSRCAGSPGVIVTLSGSEVGVSYSLKRDGNTVAIVHGNGSALSPPLDWDNQTIAGTYTVEAVRGECTQVMTGSAVVVVNPLPEVHTLSIGGSYCESGSGAIFTLTGSEVGVNYQLQSEGIDIGTPLPGTSSALQWPNQTAPGYYQVIATSTLTGCSRAMEGYINFSLIPLPNQYMVGGGGSRCADGPGVSITLTGSETGVVYRLMRNGASTMGLAGTGSQIIFGNVSTGGTYTVEAIRSGCIQTMNGSAVVTVNPMPAIGVLTSDRPGYCEGDPGVNLTLDNSEMDVNYQLTMGPPFANVGPPLPGTSSSLHWTNQTYGFYNVTATNTLTGCSTTMWSGVYVTIDWPPSPYIVSGGQYCSGSAGASVTLSGSNVGIDYQLLRDGVSVGSPVTGTGSQLSWANQSIEGTYTVQATNSTSGCTATMNGSATLTEQVMQQFTLSGVGTACEGTSILVTLSGSQANVYYHLKSGATTQSTLLGTGGPLSWNVMTSGTYTVLAVGQNPPYCEENMIGSATVTINPSANDSPVYGGGEICAGTSGPGFSVHLLFGSQVGIDYQLQLNGTDVGGPKPGSGGQLSWHNLTAIGTYTVTAFNATTGCMWTMSGSASIIESPLPVQYSVSGGGGFCPGGEFGVNLIGSQSGVSYQLKLNGTNVGLPIAGTGAYLSWLDLDTEGTYTVQAAHSTTGCTQNMTGSAVATVFSWPQQFTVGGGGTFCSPESAMVALSGSEEGVTYYLYQDGSPFLPGTHKAGTGGMLNWSVLPAGTFTILAIRDATPPYCNQTMTGSATVTINAIPTDGQVTGGGEICEGSPGVFINLSGSTQGVNYQLKVNSVDSGPPLPGTGLPLTWANQTIPGTYTVFAFNDFGCTLTINGSATVSVKPLPAAAISGPHKIGTENIELVTTSGEDYTYQWFLDGDMIDGAVEQTLTVGKAGNYTVAVDLYGCSATSPAHFVTYENKPLYNGLIRSVRWRTDKPHEVTGNEFTGMYAYHYDDKYQLEEGTWAVPSFTLNTFSYAGNTFRVSDISYDPNGNILSLRRYNESGTRQHNFAYQYNADPAKPQQTNQLQHIPGYATYQYNNLGQLTAEDKDTGDDQYIEYDVSGKVRKVFSDAAKQNPKVEYIYDDRGFRLAKKNFETGKTTWYIRDASGNVMSIYETATGSADTVQTEVPVYGAGKLGTYYPQQEGSTAYEITDHLGNVRALVRDNINVYTATMEDSGQPVASNPRVLEMQDFINLFETEQTDAHMNHTPAGPQVSAPNKSAYLYWSSGTPAMSASDRAVGPGIMLKVKGGDKVAAEAWVRYEKKVSYTRNLDLFLLSQVLGTNFAGMGGFEGYTASQTASAFENALGAASFMSDGDDDEQPFAYLNYILFNENMTLADAGWKRIPDDAGFTSGQEALPDMHRKVVFDDSVEVEQNGYIYVWVSNESEDTRVWFDDLRVAHSESIVTQATDYGVWGDVIREQRSIDSTYRYGYQGQFAEKDEETGWSHFELREYDPIVARWTSTDPEGQFHSPYVGMGNDPVNGIDPDGGYLWGLFGSTRDQRKNARRDKALYGDNAFIEDLTSAKIAVVYVGDWYSDGESGDRYFARTTYNTDGSAKDYEIDHQWYSTLATGEVEYDPLGQLTFVPGIGQAVGAARGLSLAGRMTVTVAGRYALRQSVRNFERFMSIKDTRLFLTGSTAGIRAMARGRGIDKAFRYYAGKNLILRSASGMGLIKIGARNRGADMIGRGFLSRYWWDVTTRSSWLHHVNKYGAGGTGLIYR